jgi:hypothetical protein
MQKREARVTTEIKKWLCYNFKETCFIEVKVSVDNKPFNLRGGFKEHQLPVLMMIKNGAFGYKISDMDRMIKPFDLIFAYQAKSYVAIHWVRKGNKKFYLIDPTCIQGLIDDNIKSLSEPRAAELAAMVGELK